LENIVLQKKFENIVLQKKLENIVLQKKIENISNPVFTEGRQLLEWPIIKQFQVYFIFDKY